LPVIIGATIVLKSVVTWHSTRFLLDTVGYDPTPIARAVVPFYKAGRVETASIAADLNSRSRSVPGVTDVAAAFSKEPERNYEHHPVVTVDHKSGEINEEMAAQWSYYVVTPAYRRTYGRPLETGRDFVDGDLTSNEVMVDGPTGRFPWPKESPVRRGIRLGGE